MNLVKFGSHACRYFNFSVFGTAASTAEVQIMGNGESMTDGVCHCEEAAPTKQSGSAGLLRFARNDMNLSVRIPHHLFLDSLSQNRMSDSGSEHHRGNRIQQNHEVEGE